MGRARRIRPPRAKRIPQRGSEPAQSTLDLWLQSTGDACDILDEDLLALLAPAGDGDGDVINRGQDANPSQHTALGRPS
jgi:hypothetical protein